MYEVSLKLDLTKISLGGIKVTLKGTFVCFWLLSFLL